MAIRGGAGVVFKSNLTDIINMINKTSIERITEASNHYRNELINTMKSATRTGISYPVPARSKTTLAGGRAANRVNPTRYTASADGEIPAVASGRLVKSTRIEIKKGFDLYGIVGTTLDYAPILEYGSMKMAPRPWFWPVYLEEKATMQSIISKEWF